MVPFSYIPKQQLQCLPVRKKQTNTTVHCPTRYKHVNIFFAEVRYPTLGGTPPPSESQKER